MNIKQILIKALKLQASLELYNEAYEGEEGKLIVRQRFERTWGKCMGDHFLNKYDSAESLISALDSDNLELFINKF